MNMSLTSSNLSRTPITGCEPYASQEAIEHKNVKEHGREAAYAGACITTNPHPAGSVFANVWARGWHAGQATVEYILTNGH
jgi:hypothetical protein